MSRIIPFCLIVAGFAMPLEATTFTLSDSALLLLDSKADFYFEPDLTPMVTDIRDMAGSGVEFDIFFPGNEGGDAAFFWLSSQWEGNGSLVGIDITNYDAFALQFTLISVNGFSSEAITNPLLAGAVINRTEVSYAYDPEILRLSGPDSAISTTPTDASFIETIGFTVYIPYWWFGSSANPWSSEGSTVTLLVKGAPGAMVVPEPTMAGLMVLGGLAAVRRRRGNAALG